MQEIDINNRRYHALMVTGIMLPILLFTFFSYFFISVRFDLFERVLYSRFAIWLIVLIMVFYAQQAELQKFLMWSEKRQSFWFYLKWVAVVFLLSLGVSFITSISLRWWHEDNSILLKLRLVMMQHHVLMYFSCITAGFTEEFIFRGYMISRLSKLINNKYMPVFISAFLFGLIHLGYKNLHEFIFAFLIGLLYGFYYQKYRNIVVLIITHSIVDIVAFSVAGHRM